MVTHSLQNVTRRLPLLGILLALIIAAGALVWLTAEHLDRRVDTKRNEFSSQTKSGVFYPTAEQWATLTVEPVQQRVFQSEHVTEGKIAVDEDRSTPIFSPYAGRVIKLFVKPGDIVTVGQPLFTVQAADMVQAQNDFISAATALNKARSALNLAQIIDKRQRLLYEGKAVPLKEVQNARAALDAAENDVRSSEVALEAARNRLRILGNGSTDPVFIIGDLSTVWVVAFIRETEAPLVHVGQAIYFTVLAYPDRSFPTSISYVAAAIDATTRRLLVRATVNNSAGLLKPEMFASVKILTGEGDKAVAVPRDAIIYEGEAARVWVVRDKDSEKAIELRRIKVGLTNGNMVEVVKGLAPGDRVVTKGSLFIDRVAAGT